MAKQLVDKKVNFIGVWEENVVSRDTISQINAQIQNEKGSKVRLQLYVDGLRVVKTALVLGRTLHEFIPFPEILFMTVSKHTPNFLLVIAKGREAMKKYQIQAFKCANGMDAGMFLEGFRSIKTSVSMETALSQDVNSPGHGLNANIKTHDGINWTLRDKEHDNSKRELKQLVNIHGEKAVVEKNTDVRVGVQNGHSSTEKVEGVRIYRKGKPQLQKASIEVDQLLPNGEISDAQSETDNVSESALRVELESLSHELRDIKLMLEKSTGITAAQHEDLSPRTVQYDKNPATFRTTTITQTTNPQEIEALDAVVLDEDDDDDDDKKRSPRENGTEKQGSVVRISVPDYRTVVERTSTSTSPVSQKKDMSSGYGSVTSRTSTTSYENWKRHTTSVPYNEMQERLQWRSRPVTVQGRPRSSLPSWSTDVTDSSQVHMRVARPQTYRVVSFDPRTRPVDRKAHSLRARAFSTTVAKPIEKVYRRPEAVHSSLVYRPQSVNIRPTILANGSLRGTGQIVYVEPNNNAIKSDEEHALLDVSGVDLDQETPRETIIRT